MKITYLSFSFCSLFKILAIFCSISLITFSLLMPMIGTIGKPMIVNIPDDEIDFAIKNVALIKYLSIQSIFPSNFRIILAFLLSYFRFQISVYRFVS